VTEQAVEGIVLARLSLGKRDDRDEVARHARGVLDADPGASPAR
jgi:hypothetical protein